MGSGCGRVWGCKRKWRLRANGVAWWCCGALSGGDVDACGGGGDAHGGGDQTCVGSCGGGGDCCDVVVGKVVAAQRLVGLMQWMVILMVGSQWLKW